jgi:origin recognition complex subunit 1
VRAVLKGLLDRNVFDWVEVNGMKVPCAQDIYTILYNRLSGKHVAHPNATRRLDGWFKSSTRPCVLVIDEMDALLKISSRSRQTTHMKHQSILYRLLEWPSVYPLCIIAIANTMDLPERYFSPRIVSRLGVLRVNFTPYTYPQLMRIIRDKCQSANDKLTPDAIEYCARKIGAVSGDARRAISLANRALSLPGQIGLAEMEGLVHSQNHSSPMFILPLLDIHCKLILVSLFVLRKKEETDKQHVDSVIEHAWQLSCTLSVTCPTYVYLLKALRSLQSMGLLSQGNMLLLQAIHDADIHKAYSNDPMFSRFLL